MYKCPSMKSYLIKARLSLLVFAKESSPSMETLTGPEHAPHHFYSCFPRRRRISREVHLMYHHASSRYFYNKSTGNALSSASPFRVSRNVLEQNRISVSGHVRPMRRSFAAAVSERAPVAVASANVFSCCGQSCISIDARQLIIYTARCEKRRDCSRRYASSASYDQLFQTILNTHLRLNNS